MKEENTLTTLLKYSRYYSNINSVELKEELTKLILSLIPDDYDHFCSNYQIKEGRGLLEFIEDLDENTLQEVISEIHFNTEIDY